MAEPIAYSSYRLNITKNTGGSAAYMSVSEWRMWETYSPALTDADFMVGGTASAQSTNGSYSPSNAFDKNSETTWESTSASGAKWLRYDLPAPRKAKALFIQHGTWTGEAPSDFVLQGSNDGGATWDNIKTYTNFLTSATAAAGRLVSVGAVQISGKALLDNGAPATRVLIYNYATGALMATLYPGADGSFMYYPDISSEVLVVSLGPSGYRPQVEGPITPLVVA